MTAMRLLIVEDDVELATMLARGFAEEGFEVEREEDGPTGLSAALVRDHDCVLLDVMLPGIDGMEVCRRLRRDDRIVPVIMLTVRNEVRDRVSGLDAGADDYVTKPFSFEELLARVRAQIRRSELAATLDDRCGDLALDARTLSATRAGRKVELTPKEFQLLAYFVHRAGEVVTEREVIEDVWGLSFVPQTNVLNVYLHRLRKKLHAGGRPSVIETIRGRGFRLSGRR
jgi:DNA-binding response OmpR family regulator